MHKDSEIDLSCEDLNLSYDCIDEAKASDGTPLFKCL